MYRSEVALVDLCSQKGRQLRDIAQGSTETHQPWGRGGAVGQLG